MLLNCSAANCNHRNLKKTRQLFEVFKLCFFEGLNFIKLLNRKRPLVHLPGTHIIVSQMELINKIFCSLEIDPILFFLNLKITWPNHQIFSPSFSVYTKIFRFSSGFSCHCKHRCNSIKPLKQAT